MTLKTAIYNLLQADTNLTALVSTRVYRDEAIEGAALPYIVFEKINEIMTTDGRDDLFTAQFAFYIIGDKNSDETLETIKSLIIKNLQRLSKTVDSTLIIKAAGFDHGEDRLTVDNEKAIIIYYNLLYIIK